MLTRFEKHHDSYAIMTGGLCRAPNSASQCRSVAVFSSGAFASARSLEPTWDHAVSFNKSQQKSVTHLQQVHTQLCAQRQPPLRFPPNPSRPFTALGPTVKLIQRLQRHNRQTKAFRQSSEPRCLGIHRLPNLLVAWIRLVAFAPFRGTSRWRTTGTISLL